MTAIERSILRSLSMTVARLHEAKYFFFIVLVHFIRHGQNKKYQFLEVETFKNYQIRVYCIDIMGT